MPEDLRHCYGKALADHMTSSEHKYDGGPAHGFVWDWECCADAVLSVRETVRDTELEQVKDDALAVVVESAQECKALRERAETAEAAVLRARELAQDLKVEAEEGERGANIDSLRAAWKASGHAAGLLLAALDDTAGT